MKPLLKVLTLAGLVLIACSALGSCKTTAATNKHEFKKELHHMERAH